VIRRRFAIVFMSALALAVSGCGLVKGMVYFLSPPRIQRAEYKLTEGRLAILVESRDPRQTNPVFTRALHRQIVEIMRDKKAPTTVIPYMEMLNLRRGNPEFNSWSIQRIGRELNADEILYLVLDELRLREPPDSPVIEPSVTLRLKVISAQQPPPHHRLWPEEADGRSIPARRQTQEAVGGQAVDVAATKLAFDTAHLVMLPFFDVDLESPVPTAR
jgi:hypothetical protein